MISDPRKLSYTDGQAVKMSPSLPASPTLPTVSPSLPGFSGLNNCTINFSLNYGSKKE